MIKINLISDNNLTTDQYITAVSFKNNLLLIHSIILLRVSVLIVLIIMKIYNVSHLIILHIIII